MRRRFIFSARVAGFLAAGVASICVAADGDLRRFQVRDSIEMARFAEQGLFSPDGRYFATLTERGRIEQNATEATLWLFETSAVRKAIAQPDRAAVEPTVLVRMSASINGGVGALVNGALIRRMTWEPGSDSLLFLACNGNENHRLLRVGLRDRKLTALSLESQDVVDYAGSGDHIVYLAGPDVQPEKAWWANDPSTPDIVAGSSFSLPEVLFPNSQRTARYLPTEFEVWRTGDTPSPVVDTATGKPMRLLGSFNLGALGLSHDGSKLILLAHVDQVPRPWESYEVPEGLDHWRYRATPDGAAVTLRERENDYAWPLQYQVIDLKAGTRRALLESPAADFQRDLVDEQQIEWSADDRALAVTGTFLPLGPDANGPKRPCGAAVIQMADRHADCLIDHTSPKVEPVTGVSWDESNTRLLVESGGPKVFEYGHRQWKLTSRRPRIKSPPVTLDIAQDLNTPPVLTARDPHGGRRATIFDPNPQLKEIALGNVSVYEWKSAKGLAVIGGLAKPPDFRPGQRYPLVIQTHGFPRSQFFRVGYYSETANAGRALAGRGMLVLQVQEPHSPDDGTWREATARGTEVYLAAIDQLAAEGLVDPTKVGITGYSRAGGFVAKAITEAPERFAAAAVVNTDLGSQFGYYSYINYAFPNNSRRIADFFGGSLPYGAGLQDWFERAPGFNTDKIRAPVLVSAGDPAHLLSLWSLYAPLLDQHKPVELQYFRNGQHNLTKPLEVLTHQETLVDWFDFWLNGHEVADATKAAQYARWRALRESTTSQ
ncbi:MAG TPA: prolyl oligopeptidase family serine peptidase [Povalibacter sp.]|nr:prolyl oligopeptidase family serine peptidase [Povalibacter sp.]